MVAGLLQLDAEQITKYNQSRELGAVALLDAAHRAAGAEPHPASVPMVALRDELLSDSVPDRLAEQLQWQSQCLAEREAECLRRAAQLQAAQQQLATQMAEFATHVARWQETIRPATRRASA